ncbi:MAG: flavin reductase family protein [Dehalococcoidia bacterium]|nr:flavin reductase family protein [Dehalococcoidia bacterium]
MANGKAGGDQSSGNAGGQQVSPAGPLNLDALRSLTYGMYVVGSKKGDRFNAQIANTVFQITSQPPTVAVSINKNNLTHEFISESKVFSASSLCEDTPLPFIGRFGFKSGRDGDKLGGVNYQVGQTGAPVVIDNAVSYIEARVIDRVDVGTHTVFIGEIVAAEVLMQKACMTYGYYQQIKRGTTPQAAPTYQQKKA